MDFSVEFNLKKYLVDHHLSVQDLFDTLKKLEGANGLSRDSLYAYSRIDKETGTTRFPTAQSLSSIIKGLEYLTGKEVTPNDLFVFKQPESFFAESKTKEKEEGYRFVIDEFYKKRLGTPEYEETLNPYIRGLLHEKIGRALHILGEEKGLEEAIKEHRKSQENFRKIHDFISVARCLINEADSLRVIGKCNKAEEIYFKSLDMLRAPIHSPSGISQWNQPRYNYIEARAMRGIGDTHRRRGNIYESINFYVLSLRILDGVDIKEGGDETREDILQYRGYISNSLGVAYYYLEALEQAEKWHQGGLEIAEKLLLIGYDYKRVEAFSHNGLADVLRKKSKTCGEWKSKQYLQEAEKHGEEAYRLFEEIQDRRGEASALWSLAFVYLIKSQAPSKEKDREEEKTALEKYEETIAKAKKRVTEADPRGKGYNEYLEGYKYLREGKYEKAREHYLEALKVFSDKDTRNTRGERHALIDLGIVLYHQLEDRVETGKYKNNNYQYPQGVKAELEDMLKRSRKYFRKAESVLQINPASRDRIDGYNCIFLARTYIDEFNLVTRDLDKAAQYLQRALIIFDSMHDQPKGKGMAYEALGDVKARQRIKASTRQAVIHYQVAQEYYNKVYLDVEGVKACIEGKLKDLVNPASS